jgi:hypothetical protein
MAFGTGRRLAKVVAHQLGESSTGTPHVAVLFENAEGARITWYGYLSDAALERTLSSLRILGFDPSQHNGMLDVLHGTQLLVSREAELVVETEVYNGEPREKVKWVNEVGGGMGKGMEADKAKGFAASLRQKILSAQPPKPNAKPGPARQPAAAAVPAGAIDPDDDLPFAPLRLTAPLAPFGW